MNPNLHEDALHIVTSAIDAVKPDAAVRRALQGATFPGRVFLVAVGKAEWQMAHAALQCLPTPPAQGIVVTKYGHVLTDLPGIRCLEAGHPVPDENSFAATQAVLDMTASFPLPIPCCFCYPAAAARCLKSLWFPAQNCRLSPVSCLPAARTLWK